METRFLPLIGSEDYDAFRRLLNPDLPDTFDAWFNLHTEYRTDLRKKGEIVEEVEVNSHEFTRFLRATGRRANLKALEEFTLGKARGNQY
jgi:hypothetical protein